MIWFDVGFLSDAQQLVFGAVLRYHGIFVLDCLQQKDYTSTVTILIIKFHNDGQFLLECNISIVTTEFFSYGLHATFIAGRTTGLWPVERNGRLFGLDIFGRQRIVLLLLAGSDGRRDRFQK